MSNKKSAKRDDEEQSARFIKKAKEIEDDDAGPRFNDAIARILPVKQSGSGCECEDDR